MVLEANQIESISDINIGDFAELIAPVGGVVTFTAGTRIFEESDKGSEAYLIQNGYVEISRGMGEHKKIISILGPGEIFGEIALLDGDARSATAIAIHETTVAPLSQHQIRSAIECEDPLTQLLLHSAIRRLRFALKDSIDTLEMDSIKILERDDYFQNTQKKAIKYISNITSIKTAVENEEFELHYQPIINLSTGLIAGFESLIRGPKNRPDIQYPSAFIPIAEESGLILDLGLWVIENGIKGLQRFELEATRLEMKNDLFMSINVSGKQVDSQENITKMCNIINRADIDPKKIKLEITESALLVNPEHAMSSLNQLRDTGVTIAIDDFGTGYSSLNYLHRFPLDTMKIDRTFIQNLSQGENGVRIVQAMLNLAEDIKMDVVVEGIEKQGELNWLRERNCKYGQGYFIAKPQSISENLSILSKAFF